jgi:hypothetical protein
LITSTLLLSGPSVATILVFLIQNRLQVVKFYSCISLFVVISPKP